MTDAYIEGFCKTAEEHGVDPDALMKVAAGRISMDKLYELLRTGRTFRRVAQPSAEDAARKGLDAWQTAFSRANDAVRKTNSAVRKTNSGPVGLIRRLTGNAAKPVELDPRFSTKEFLRVYNRYLDAARAPYRPAYSADTLANLNNLEAISELNRDMSVALGRFESGTHPLNEIPGATRSDVRLRMLRGAWVNGRISTPLVKFLETKPEFMPSGNVRIHTV